MWWQPALGGAGTQGGQWRGSRERDEEEGKGNRGSPSRQEVADCHQGLSVCLDGLWMLGSRPHHPKHLRHCPQLVPGLIYTFLCIPAAAADLLQDSHGQ